MSTPSEESVSRFTSRELLEQLARNSPNDPKIAAHVELGMQRIKMMQPIMNELKNCGCSFETLDDLRESGVKYKLAIPILAKWLTNTDNEDLLRGIVGALSVPWAKKFAAKPLVDFF